MEVFFPPLPDDQEGSLEKDKLQSEVCYDLKKKKNRKSDPFHPLIR